VNARRVLIVLGIVVLGAAAVYSLQPADAPAVDFADSLKGPSSPQFDIPFEKFTLTPDGLLRSYSASGRANGNDRPVVRTRSDQYLSRDFVFEVDITIPADVEDIAFVGFGEGVTTTPHNEPGGAFGFRIHALPTIREVRFAGMTSPARGASVMYPTEEVIGSVPSTGALTLRLERFGDHIIGSLPGQEGSERTIRISGYPSVLRNKRGFLYLSNTAEGTVFSNVRVRPRT
jgi:hypothetical protein